ncbi:MAG: hypothetical protein A2X80_08910 [Geobacteraceae bacterium GWB2_52_12]|nr:MAG: hypothetical protein A2X80_08910 [Geobacteraceae bacterium GWB2_52_12]
MNSINSGSSDAASGLRRLVDSTLSHGLLIVMMALVAYANTFSVPFIFDDETSIVRNEVIHNLDNFLTNRSGYDSMPNRYVAYLSFALNYYVGGMNVVGYHVVNLVIHIANGLLVYALVGLTLRTPFFVRGSDSDTLRSYDPTHRSSLAMHHFLPLFAALLFICHPIQTQAVTYIVQRITSLATLFFLASLVLHVRWRLARESGDFLLSRQVLPFWLLSLVSAILAMKTKEIAFTLPPAVLLYEFCFFGRPSTRRLVETTPLFLTALIIPSTMLTLHKEVGQILSSVGRATMESNLLSRWEYLFTQFSVIVTYLRLLVLPVNQNLDHDYPVNHSLLEPRAFLSLALLLALFGLALCLYYHSRLKLKKSRNDLETCELRSSLFPHRFSRLTAFGIFWFFLTLSVESSVIPINDLIFEHRLYLPSIGFFIALVGLTCRFCTARTSVMCAAMGVIVTVTLCFSTYMRNTLWKSEVDIWRDSVSKSPEKSRPHANLGVAYGKQEQVAEALLQFDSAVSLAPDQTNPYEFITPGPLSNIVILYVSAGRLQQAAAACKALLKLDPDMELPLNLYQILRMPRPDDEALLLVRNVCGVE